MLALLPICLDGGIHLIVAEGIDILEREIFQFAANLAHAQPVREWRVDVEGFARDELLAIGWKVLQRAHVVQTISQFDQHDAHIGNHGEEHFADVFRLTVFAIGELDFFDFGDTINNVRDLIAELFCDLAAGDGCVFNSVMQQARRDGSGIELHLGEDERDLQWMEREWIAGGAALAGVILQAKLVSFVDDGKIVGRTIATHGIQQHLESLCKALVISIRS